MRGTTRPVRILHAEDSLADAELTRLALEDGEVTFDLYHVRDGVEALEFLRSDAPRPDVMLLDLNMPRMGGHEVLRTVKQDARLKSIPVIVLSTSSNPDDVDRCYEEHGNCYVRKPVDFDSFSEAVRRIERFWLSLAVLAEMQ